MFERYTEKARRVIFFARYEASQFGASAIEPEYILLGLLREDKGLVNRFFPKGWGSIESVRKKIKERTPPGEKVSTSVDMPLSRPAKTVLAHAHEESERLRHRYIGTEHLLLGLLRDEKSLAGEILRECGVRLNQVRKGLGEDPSVEKEISFDDDALRALVAAQEEAAAAGTNSAGALHLLLGILRDEGSRAARLLAAHGDTIEVDRGEIDEDAP
jgi:ATP-dependent Clp protease ATP-binding subunit ClpC